MKPVLFNTEMVKKILRGQKTMTRRIIRPRYKKDEGGIAFNINKKSGDSWVEKTDWDGYMFDPPRYVKPPYEINDVLYVRETWNRGYIEQSDAYLNNESWFEEHLQHDGGFLDGISNYFYRADFNLSEESELHMTWKPSIHMPKEAARIFLRITDVKVEKLQEITVDDALHEGCSIIKGLESFKKLWNKIVFDKITYGWDANPFVWVYTFERINEVNK
jgi:hypothetical protein